MPVAQTSAQATPLSSHPRPSLHQHHLTHTDHHRHHHHHHRRRRRHHRHHHNHDAHHQPPQPPKHSRKTPPYQNNHLDHCDHLQHSRDAQSSDELPKHPRPTSGKTNVRRSRSVPPTTTRKSVIHSRHLPSYYDETNALPQSIPSALPIFLHVYCDSVARHVDGDELAGYGVYVPFYHVKIAEPLPGRSQNARRAQLSSLHAALEFVHGVRARAAIIHLRAATSIFHTFQTMVLSITTAAPDVSTSDENPRLWKAIRTLVHVLDDRGVRLYVQPAVPRSSSHMRTAHSLARHAVKLHVTCPLCLRSHGRQWHSHPCKPVCFRASCEGLVFPHPHAYWRHVHTYHALTCPINNCSFYCIESAELDAHCRDQHQMSDRHLHSLNQIQRQSIGPHNHDQPYGTRKQRRRQRRSRIQDIEQLNGNGVGDDDRHNDSVNRRSKGKSVWCTFCGTSCKSSRALIRHLRRQCEDAPRCDECGRHFLSEHALQIHIQRKIALAPPHSHQPTNLTYLNNNIAPREAINVNPKRSRKLKHSEEQLPKSLRFNANSRAQNYIGNYPGGGTSGGNHHAGYPESDSNHSRVIASTRVADREMHCNGPFDGERVTKHSGSKRHVQTAWAVRPKELGLTVDSAFRRPSQNSGRSDSSDVSDEDDVIEDDGEDEYDEDDDEEEEDEEDDDDSEGVDKEYSDDSYTDDEYENGDDDYGNGVFDDDGEAYNANGTGFQFSPIPRRHLQTAQPTAKHHQLNACNVISRPTAGDIRFQPSSDRHSA